MKNTEKQKNKLQDNGIIDIKNSAIKKVQAICPVCHRPEKGNTRQEDLVMCGRCTALRAIKYQNTLDNRTENQLPKKERVFEPREITCNYAGCDNKLMQNSPRQKYCPSCKRKVAVEKAKERMSKKRKG
jgi:hypothetical protein